jgi:hypothetical protein
VTPCWNWTTVFSKKDLKPSISRVLSCIGLPAQERFRMSRTRAEARERVGFYNAFSGVFISHDGGFVKEKVTT